VAQAVPDNRNEAVTVTSSTPADAADATPLTGPAAPRLLHDDELLYHAEHDPADHQVILKPNWMAAHYINVGQGNATLLEFSCGAALIDSGGQLADTVNSNQRLTDYLDTFFRRRTDLNKTLDVVILTHPHIDHTRGMGASKLGQVTTPGIISDTGVSRYKIRAVVTNAESKGSGISGQNRLLAYARAQGIPIESVRNARIVRSDGLTNATIDPINCAGASPDIRVLWGSDDRVHGWTDEPNNHSVVVRVDFGESSFLFTGDLEEDAQPEFIRSYSRYPSILDVDVYEVGHHGSRNGTSIELVKAMTPEIAIISAGDPSDEEPGYAAFGYGHPNTVAIAALSTTPGGVSQQRPAKRVAVGLRGQNVRTGAPGEYEYQVIDRAIYATGWDGTIVITASATGEKAIHTQ